MNPRRHLLLPVVFMGCLVGGPFGVLPPAVASEHPGSFDVGVSLGAAAYVEELSSLPVDSEWDGGAAGLFFKGLLPLDPLILSIRGNLLDSDKDREEWRYDDVLVQLNDLEVEHKELLFDIGFIPRQPENFHWFPYVGIGMRQQEFRRSNFVALNARFSDGPHSVSRVDESYDIYYVNLGVSLIDAGSLTWDIGLRADLGLVFHNEADNSLLGKVDGDGGAIFQLEGYAAYPVAENHLLGVGLKLDAQLLNGDYSVTASEAGTEFLEWPDNAFSQLLLTLFWKVEL